jgi:hypothetical protein
MCTRWWSGHTAAHTSSRNCTMNGYTVSRTDGSTKQHGPRTGGVACLLLNAVIALSTMSFCVDGSIVPWTGDVVNGFSASPSGSWRVIGCAGYFCPVRGDRPYTTLAVVAVDTYISTTNIVLYATSVACLSPSMSECQLACTNMPLCRGISIESSMMLLLGDGSIVTAGLVMARCGTPTVPCPTAVLTFEMSTIVPQNVDIQAVGVTIDNKTVHDTSITLTVSGAQTGAYIQMPVVSSTGTGTDAAPTLASIIAASIAVPLMIASMIFRIRRLS